MGQEIEHRTVKVNGVNIHVAIKGPSDGPVVLFLHGFMAVWYFWRHQISAFAALGYRTITPDLRGYGDSDVPPEISSYSCFHLVGDVVGLLATVAPDQEKVFVVGHNWGAVIGWYLSLFRPDKVKAVVSLGIPLRLFDPTRKPIEGLRDHYGDDYYMCRFQKPGDMESEFEEIGTERVLKTFLTKHSPAPHIVPKDKSFWGSLETPIALPSWLTEEEVQYYITKFQKSGFAGGLNYYRNLDRDYELMAPWVGRKIEVPAKFIVGDEDLVYHMAGVKDYVTGGDFKNDVPLLEEPVIMEGVSHFLNQEKVDEVNQYIFEFIKKF